MRFLLKAVLVILASLSLHAALVSEYRFDEYVYGGILRDSVSNRDLTEENLTSTQGILCRGGLFDEDQTRVRGEWQERFDQELTVTLWVRIAKRQDASARLLEMSDESGDYEYGSALAFDSRGRSLRGWIYGDGHRSTEVSYRFTSYMDDRWHMVAMTYRYGSLRLYVDGELKDTESVTIADIADPKTLAIGSNYLLSDRAKFEGGMDEIKIYTHALSDQEIQELYNNEKSGKDYTGIQRICPLRAEYRMDECSWDGVGAVKDSSPNGFDATAQIAKTSLVSVICRGGDFTYISSDNTDDSDDDLVQLPPQTMDGLQDFTIATWIKTTKEKFTILSAANDTQYNEAWFYSLNSTTFRNYIKGSYRSYSLLAPINDDRWHHVVWTREGKKGCLYVDAVLQECRYYTNDLALNVKGVVLAQDQDKLLGDYQAYQAFDGYMDEVKIFGEALDQSQIQEIYQKELAGYDAVEEERICNCCEEEYSGPIVPLEFEGGHVELKNTYADPTWTYIPFQAPFSSVPVVFMVIDSRGSHPASVRIRNITTTGFEATLVEPQGEDGPHLDQTLSYFAINKGVHKLGDHLIEVGTIETKKVQGRYAPAGNEIGWEEVEPKLKICNRAVVANIQTLNNLSSNPPRDPLIPWATAALRTNGNNIYLALDMSETSQGVFSTSETIGYMIGPANIQDSFIDDFNRTIDYETIATDPYFVGWDNGCKSVSLAQSYDTTPLIAGWKMSRYGTDGGWFRRCALDTTKVGFLVDEDRAHDRERAHVAEEGGIFVFSDPFSLRETLLEGVFNAVSSPGDDGVCEGASDWENNLTTQIVKRPFSLYLLAKDKETNTSIEANITQVSLYYYDLGDTSSCSGTSRKRIDLCLGNGCPAIGADGCAKLENIKLESAAKCIRVSIKGMVGSEEFESNATDNFALRPKEFGFILPSLVYAADPFEIDFVAKDEAQEPSKDYNESYGSSFVVEINETKLGCVEEAIDMEAFAFRDGEAKDVEAQYPEIGDLNLTLKEIEGSEFASVDRDDTPDPQRYIQGASQILHVLPYEINITKLEFIPSTATFWLYMAQDLEDMNVTLKATLSVFSRTGELMEDFNASCYGKDLDLRFMYDTDYREEVNITSTIADGTIQEINQTLTVPKEHFGGGMGMGSYAFGIDRNFTRAVSPVFVQLKEVNITTPGIAKYLHSATMSGVVRADMNATFYYGRIRPKDLVTSMTEDNTTATILVYDGYGSDYTKEFNQSIIGWYINSWHTSQIYGQIKDLNATLDIYLAQDPVTLGLMKTLKEGIYAITVQNDDKIEDAFIHLDISPWLWYSYHDEDQYRYTPGSTCSHHPCIRYFYHELGQSSGVKSGEVEGVGFDQNVTRGRRGVKVFR
ncbi:MAG: hypothetical protein C6H99_02015 [Epsilonproteobacteria bacterium]|nr:hypothetical protein [Campylobacterota bacterium]NPA63858.1 hypothetical protein [Campylobacterota bacterium]